MSKGSPPSLIGGFKVRRSGRRIKYSEKGRDYQSKMSATKLESCFKAKDRVFSEAATIIITKENPEGCCDQLAKIKAEMIEALNTLKATDTHKPHEDRFTNTIASIDSMISFYCLIWKVLCLKS